MIRHLILTSFFSLLLAISGCAAVGAVIGKTVPPPPVPAQFVPAQTPLVVIAENKSAATSTVIDGDRLNRLVTNEFDEYQIAPTISPDDLIALRDSTLSKFDSMSIQSIGKNLGAKQVLYIDITGVGAGAAPGSDIVRGVASAQVKLIDVDSGYVVFPEGATSGQPVSFQTRPTRAVPGMSPASLRGEALDGLAHNIVKLSRNWQPDEEPSDLGVDQ